MMQMLAARGPMIAAGVAVCLIATAAVCAFVVRPAITRGTEASAQAAEVADRMDALRDAARQLQQARERLAQATAKVAAERRLLAAPAQLNEKVTHIVQMAEHYKLLVTAMRPEQSVRSGDHTVQPLTLTASATYADLRAFAAELRRVHPDVVIESLVLSQTGAALRPMNLQARLLWHGQPRVGGTATPSAAPLAGVAP
ncbi:MAG TPA: type 4a pilus biogenesis protein PilO [Tepidisphaeraceae bacterium]|jgi:Tfp pilus assembly protein PilO|nr:type 4a pilus biogenesis protein PilO [Tepidisphaeraceae bacterium]